MPVMFEGSPHATETTAWQQFWSGRVQASEHRYRDPAIAAVLDRHWQDFFTGAFRAGMRVDLVDLACGEGEVLRFADRFAAARADIELNPVCADVAHEAVQMAAASPAAAAPAVADCARLPFADESFTCAVSQYGLEYAGPDAFSEAARVVGEGGRFHALVHCEGGAVDHACRNVATLLVAVLESGLFDRLADYAATIPRAAAGEVPHAQAQACVDALRAALTAVGTAVSAADPGPARDHVARLAGDSQTLAGRLAAYAPADVTAWIAGQKAEIEAFHHRMTSMVRVAQSDADVKALSDRLDAAGLAVDDVATLAAPEGDRPLAWVLNARRGKRA